MCGILGTYILNGTAALPTNERFGRAVTAMAHRGPDARGTFTEPSRVKLGHVRLSILDLSPEANQPFRYGDICLVFNGEIYNYLEIKEDLCAKGYEFRTTSDTEVVAAAYQEWNVDCLPRFNGMWGLAIYDRRDASLFLARDRFGVKPLYYHSDGLAFYFGSVIKSLLVLKPDLRKPDLNTIAGYCRESVGGESLATWFEGVSRLAPAHYITIKNGKPETVRYWDYPTESENSVSFDQAIQTYRVLFEDATRLRMRSDVPVGATLSSGVDSQSIVAMAQRVSGQPLLTYTASFPRRPYDEFEVVRSFQAEMGYQAHQQIVSYENFLPELQSLIYHLESGHSSPAIFPLSQVLQRAKKEVTVFLEGQGADELLGGYINAIFCEYWLDMLKAGQFKIAWADLRAFRRSWSLPYAILLYLRTSLPSWLRKVARKAQGVENMYGPGLGKYADQPVPQKYAGLLKQRLYEQHTGGLVNLLHYGDNISMMHSLESRLPFMDYRLVEYVFKLPDTFLIRRGLGKSLHREAMRGIVPDEILANKNKIGFTSPFEEVFHDPALLSYMNRHPLITEETWFKSGVLKRFIRDVVSGRKKQHRLLFRVLCVMLWYDAFIKPDLSPE